MIIKARYAARRSRNLINYAYHNLLPPRQSTCQISRIEEFPIAVLMHHAVTNILIIIMLCVLCRSATLLYVIDT